MYKKRDNKYNIDNLFSIPTKNKEITISHWPVAESLSRIAFRVVLFCALFLFFNQLGEWLSAKEWFFTRGGFDTSFLYSMFLLPLLHSLRDIVHCFDSCWTHAYIVNDSIVVKRGLTYTAYDKLYVKDINNIEMYRGMFGKMFGYSTITMYALGGIVSIPFIKDDKKNHEMIKNLIKQVSKNQQKRHPNKH